MEKVQKNAMYRVLLFIGIIIAFVFIAQVIKPVFGTADDLTMRNIVSGLYTGVPDGHTVFIGYPLALLLSKLYMLYSDIAWYGLFFLSCLVISAYLILSEILFNNYKTKGQKITAYSGAILIFFGMHISSYITMYFTVIAGILGATAVFSVLRGKKKITIIIFLILCFLVRSDIFVMSCPFVLAAGLWNYISETSDIKILKAIKKCTVMGVIISLIFILGTVIEKSAYSSDEWKYYSEYNHNRAMLYDYAYIYGTDEYKKQCSQAGIDEEQYNILKHCDLWMDSRITADKMGEAYKRIEKVDEESKLLKGLKVLFWLFKQCFIMRWYYTIVLLGLLAYLSYRLIKEKEKLKLFLLGCVVVGKNIIFCYFIWLERLPERVFKCGYLLELLFLIAITIDYLRNAHKICINKKIIVLFSIFALGVAAQMYYHIIPAMDQNEIMEQYSQVEDYCKLNEKETYFLELSSFQAIKGNVFESGIVDNVYIMDWWLGGSPLVGELMKNAGVIDAAEYIAKKDNVKIVFSIENDYKWIDDYFQVRYDGCKFNIIDTIECTGGAKYGVAELTLEE